MADPVIQKIDLLTGLGRIAVGADLMVVLDSLDTNPVTKTKLVSMNQLHLDTASQLANNIVETDKIKDAAVTLVKMAANSVDSGQIVAGALDAAHFADQTLVRNLVYMQIFGMDELISGSNTLTKKFWVPSHFSGKKILTVGMALYSKASNDTATTVNFGSAGGWGTVSTTAPGMVESTGLSISLPAAGTGMGIYVTAGTTTPKGLDFWFVVG